MTDNNMTAERRLQRVLINIMRNPKFSLVSSGVSVGTRVICDKTPTAKTNGRDEWYGRAFITRLSEEEIAFLVLHEWMHKLYRHLTIWAKLHKEDARLTNMACDYVINLMLRDFDKIEQYIAMPRNPDGTLMGLCDERFRGMNTKQVFDILKQEQQSGGGCKGSQDSGGELDDHDWDGAQEMTADEKDQLARDVEQAVREGLINDKKHNGGGGDMARALGDLLVPKVDWRRELREFVKSVCAGRDTSSWRKPNRRFLGEDIFMPTMVSERVGHVVVAVDTSGSIGGKEIQEFLSEVQSIAEEVNPETVDLLYWDSRVAAHETYNDGAVALIAQSTKPKGGGGTAPSCVSRYLADKRIEPEVIIVLTDGYVGGDWGNNWTAPILWCIVGDNAEVATHGRTIHIKGD